MSFAKTRTTLFQRWDNRLDTAALAEPQVCVCVCVCVCVFVLFFVQGKMKVIIKGKDQLIQSLECWTLEEVQMACDIAGKMLQNSLAFRDIQ